MSVKKKGLFAAFEMSTSYRIMDYTMLGVQW